MNRFTSWAGSLYTPPQTGSDVRRSSTNPEDVSTIARVRRVEMMRVVHGDVSRISTARRFDARILPNGPKGRVVSIKKVDANGTSHVNVNGAGPKKAVTAEGIVNLYYYKYSDAKTLEELTGSKTGVSPRSTFENRFSDLMGWMKNRDTRTLLQSIVQLAIDRNVAALRWVFYKNEGNPFYQLCTLSDRLMHARAEFWKRCQRCPSEVSPIPIQMVEILDLVLPPILEKEIGGMEVSTWEKGKYAWPTFMKTSRWDELVGITQELIQASLLVSLHHSYRVLLRNFCDSEDNWAQLANIRTHVENANTEALAKIFEGPNPLSKFAEISNDIISDRESLKGFSRLRRLVPKTVYSELSQFLKFDICNVPEPVERTMNALEKRQPVNEQAMAELNTFTKRLHRTAIGLARQYSQMDMEEWASQPDTRAQLMAVQGYCEEKSVDDLDQFLSNDRTNPFAPFLAALEKFVRSNAELSRQFPEKADLQSAIYQSEISKTLIPKSGVKGMAELGMIAGQLLKLPQSLQRKENVRVAPKLTRWLRGRPQLPLSRRIGSDDWKEGLRPESRAYSKATIE